MNALRLCLAGWGALVLAAFAAPPRVTYDLTPVMNEAGVLSAIQVDVRFTGDADGATDLHVPNEWGGQQELWRGVQALQVVSGAAMDESAEPGSRTLHHRPHARIHLRYRLIQDRAGAPQARDGNAYRVLLQPTYFHLIGEAAFVQPQIDGQSPTRVRIRNLPRGWTFASDLEHAALPLENLTASVTVGGDFRVLRVRDQRVRVAIRGDWGFSDEALIEEAAAILAAQRSFWGDPPRPFLVTVLQLSADPGWLSIGGTGLGDAFAFFATPNAEAHQITRTLAHEGLHTWIPNQIGKMPDTDEARDYWLSEGFTDFYAGRLLVRQGVWGPTEFAADLNAMLAAYAASPARSAPNTRVIADFWRDRDVQQLPYQRGRLLATIWDARLRATGARDLDDVMLDMRARAAAGDPLKAGDLFPVAIGVAGEDVSADLAAYVERGDAVVLPEDVFAPCGRVVTRTAPVFHRGFDIDATQANNNVISGVDPTLAAYAAGLRDGVVLIRRDGGEIGNADVEIAYVVLDGESERTVRYMPRGQGTLELQRLDLAEPLQGETLARCLRVLGGD